MDVTPLVRADAQIIQSYKGGSFKVSGAVYGGAVLVSPDETVLWDVAGGFEALTIGDFDVIAAMDTDVVLLGTGAKMAFPPIELRRTLKAAGLNVEAMDTAAACRTFNVLMAEGRRVVAALIPVGVF